MNMTIAFTKRFPNTNRLHREHDNHLKKVALPRLGLVHFIRK